MAERKRRQYGTGSIYQRSSDGRWFGAVQAGWKANGTRRTITRSAGTEAEVKKKLAVLQRKITKDGVPALGTGRPTVKSWSETWLDFRKAELKPQPYTQDRSAVRKWIVPTIGHRRLDELTPGDIRAVGNALRTAGLKSSSALRVHATLTKMLKDASTEVGGVPTNVFDVRRPGVNPHDRQSMLLAEAVACLEVAVDLLPHSSRWATALLAGLRQAEALGLTRDRDLGSAFDVSWQLQPLPYNVRYDRTSGFRIPDHLEARQLEGRLHLTRPKSQAGIRLVPIVPWLRRALDAWYKIAPESPHGLIWPALDGGPATADDDLEEWYALQETAGVRHPSGQRYYFGHETRHTTATLLLEAGVDPEVIKAIVGHSSIVATQAYLHASDALTAEALARVAARLQLEA